MNTMILFAVLLLLGLVLVIYALANRVAPDAARQRRAANSTGTALALTSDALLGPFPTATAPTATASQIPSPTWTPTRTPTRTPTSTPTPHLFVTLTARTNAPRATFTNTPRPPTTSTPGPTRRPPPTQPPPTSYQ